MSLALPLDPLSVDPSARRRHGAKSEAGVFIGDLLMREVPALARGDLEIVAIARRPGVQTKVAVRRRRRQSQNGAPVALQVSIGADDIRRVRAQLDQEGIHIVHWHRDQRQYVGAALGLGVAPPMSLMWLTHQAHVLLGEIDFRGVPGWRAVNLVLASTLTGWRIRLLRLAESPAWRALERALAQQSPVPASVVGRRPSGLLVVVHGLDAVLPYGQIRGVDRHSTPEAIEALLEQRLGEEAAPVKVLRLDPDEGRIVVSERVAPPGQLTLPL